MLNLPPASLALVTRELLLSLAMLAESGQSMVYVWGDPQVVRYTVPGGEA